MTLRNAVAAASRSALVVAAAGNSGAATVEYPAAYPEVVSVAATDRRDAHAAFSTANAKVEIAAPGVDVIVDLERRRLPDDLGHVDVDPARGRRRGDHRRAQPRRRPGGVAGASSTRRSTTSGPPGATRSSAWAG